MRAQLARPMVSSSTWLMERSLAPAEKSCPAPVLWDPQFMLPGLWLEEALHGCRVLGSTDEIGKRGLLQFVVLFAAQAIAKVN